MFVASYSHTMANARKFKPAPSDVEVRDLRGDRIAHERAERAAERKARADRQREILRRERAEADAAIRAANEALANLHKAWADAGENEDDFKVVAPKMSVHQIMRRFCRATGVSENAVLSPRRDDRTVLVRHAIIYWACRRTTRSLPEIGRAMGGKDHTTCLSARKRYPDKRLKMGRYLKPVR